MLDLGLGLGLVPVGTSASLGGASGPTWPLVLPNGTKALFDEDNTNGRYFYAGKAYTTFAAFMIAVGGTSSGITRTIGPNVFGATLVTNGVSPITTTAGWTAVQGTLSAAGNNLLHTNSTGATSALQVYQDIAFVAGKTYEIKFTAIGGANRRIDLTDGSNTTIMELINTITAASYTYYFAAQTGITRLLLRADNVGNGSAAQWNNISIKECVPFTGWLPNGFTAAFRGTTPASVASDQVLFESGGTNENNRVRLVYKSDGHLHYIESRSTTSPTIDRLNLDLGAIAASTPFRAAVSAQNGAWIGSLNGVIATSSATPVDYPTAGLFYINTDSAAATNTGGYARCTVFPTASSGDVVSGLANPGSVDAMIGDSYQAGQNGIGLVPTYTANGRATYSKAVGGTDDVSQLAGLLAAPGIKSYNFIWDDGRANTGYDPTLYLQNQQTFMSFIGHSRYIRVAPVSVPGDPNTAQILATCDGLRAIVPAANFIDPRDVLPNTAGVINADQLQVDGVHLNQTAVNAMVTALEAKATALGFYTYVAP